MGICWGTHWEFLEHVGELDEKTLGTKEKNEKSPLSPQAPIEKKKNRCPFNARCAF